MEGREEGIGWKAADEGIGWKEEDKGIGWREESALEMMDAKLMTPPTSNSVAFARPPTNSVAFARPPNLVAFTTPTTPPSPNLMAIEVPSTTSVAIEAPSTNSVAFKAPSPSNIVAFTVPTTPSPLNIVAFTAPTTTPDIVTLTTNVVADLGSQREVRLASRDESTESTRQRYLPRFVLQLRRRGRYPAPEEGDLVLLCQHQQKNGKLKYIAFFYR